jgi:hypothetical protein
MHDFTHGDLNVGNGDVNLINNFLKYDILPLGVEDVNMLVIDDCRINISLQSIPQRLATLQLGHEKESPPFSMTVVFFCNGS